MPVHSESFIPGFDMCAYANPHKQNLKRHKALCQQNMHSTFADYTSSTF